MLNATYEYDAEFVELNFFFLTYECHDTIYKKSTFL